MIHIGKLQALIGASKLYIQFYIERISLVTLRTLLDILFADTNLENGKFSK